MDAYEAVIADLEEQRDEIDALLSQLRFRARKTVGVPLEPDHPPQEPEKALEREFRRGMEVPMPAAPAGNGEDVILDNAATGEEEPLPRATAPATRRPGLTPGRKRGRPPLPRD